MLVIIRGAGDLATGIALRLKRAHISVIMTDIPAPTAIRRTVPATWLYKPRKSSFWNY